MTRDAAHSRKATIRALVGTDPAALAACDGPEQVPRAAGVVVVGGDLGAARSLLEAVRERVPRARCVAAPRSAGPERTRELLALGFDEVAVGSEHLARVVGRLAAQADAEARMEQLVLMHEGMLQVVREIARKPDLRDVLHVAVLQISALFGIERVSVVIFDQEGKVGYVVMEREKALLERIAIDVAEYPELQQVISTHEALIIPDVFGDALLAGVRGKLTHAREPHQAAVLFPLLRKEQVVGALFLRSNERMGAVDESILTMGRLIADVTAVAIGHALEHDTLLSEKHALQRSKDWAEEQLAGVKELKDFLDQARDGVLITGSDGVIRYANAASATILHRELEDLPGRSFRDLTLPNCHAVAERALRGDAVGDENGYVDLVVGTDGDGGSVVISAAIRPLAVPEGVVISFRDVTAQREIESELRQTKEFLENLIQSSVDAIIATDTDGRVILFNRAAEQMLGYTAQEVVGRSNVSAFYQRGEAWDVMRKLRSEAYGGRGRLQMVRKELVAKSGEVVPVNLTAAIIYEGAKEVATVSILSDLRERRRIEEKLSQVQRKLQMTERQAVAVELAGVAAHELNQPLTSILGYAEMLRRRVPEGDPGRKAVEVICREAERMASIVKKIGQITAYQTKPYVGSSQILDIGEGGGGLGEPDLPPGATGEKT